MAHDMSDADLHRHATAYAAKNGVSYVEALHRAAAFAETTMPAATAAPAPAPTRERTEAETDALARDYARAHGVDYVTALRAVMATPTAAHAEAASGFAGMPPELAMAGQPIEIFRAGQHQDNAGVMRSYSVADVKAMAEAYSPALRAAVHTIGHPVDDRPEVGKVRALHATTDGRLLAMSEGIDPTFALSVKNGQMPNRSAAFFTPNDPQNPVKGSWYLKHVGWLGAQPPAIKGLAGVSFGEPAHAAVSF